MTVDSKPHLGLKDILTDHEMKLAWTIFHEVSGVAFVNVLADEIINPKIEQINKATEQQNDPRYLAYLVQYVFLSFANVRKAQTLNS